MQARTELTLVQTADLARINSRVHGLPIGVLGLVVAVLQERMNEECKIGEREREEAKKEAAQSLFPEETHDATDTIKSMHFPPRHTANKHSTRSVSVLLDVKS